MAQKKTSSQAKPQNVRTASKTQAAAQGKSQPDAGKVSMEKLIKEAG